VASNKTAEDLVGTFSCSIFQQLPWGPQLQITTTPVYHNIPYDRFGNIYGRPWFSSVTGSIFLPLPGTKNFGPYSPQDASIKVAQQQREQALWDFKAQINAILREADARYLALINAIMNVDSAIKNRKSVEELAAQTAQLFGAGRTTQFGKDQVDSELLRVKQSEEAAWNAYVATSDSLVELLNMDPGTLLVPVAYSKALNERLAYEGANAAAVGLENRAELKSASAAVKISRITLKFQRQQDRPDLSFTSSITMSQTQYANGDHPGFRGTGGIGYATIGESLENVLRRDMQDESYSLTYNRSLFHRGEHARIQEAEAGLDQQKLNLRATENGVKNQVNDAVATLDASKAAVEAAKAHLDNARKAYDMTLELQKAGRITEFEMITKNQDLYTAEYALNAVLTQYKQAETQLLFAQGVLAARYPERTAPNEFDKYRLGLLRASNALQFFGEGKEKKAP
jgi:outer membrane protein TolC